MVGSTVNLSWTRVDRRRRRRRYNVHRGTSGGFTPSAANRIAQPTGTSYTDTGLAIGTYYYKVTAEDAAGNIERRLERGHRDRRRRDRAHGADRSSPRRVAGSTINVSWTAATDNIGVARYNLHRGTTSRLHALAPRTGSRSRRAQPTPTPSLAPGTLLLQADGRGRRRQHRASLEHRQRDRRRHDRAQRTRRTHRDRRRRPGGAQLDGGDRQRRRHPLQRASLDDSRLHARAGNRIAQPTGTSYTDTGLAAGTYYYKVTAEDAAGNISAASTQATATVTAAARVGLVAAYGFDEGSGHDDGRPVGHRQQRHARQRDLGRATAGKFGNALTLQRHEQRCHHRRLDLARPHDRDDARSLGATDDARQRLATRSIFKEQPATTPTPSTPTPARNRPSANIYSGGDRDARGTAALAAQHLDTPRRHLRRHRARASTSTASRSRPLVDSGAIVTSTGALRIGGNTIWGEYFHGLIDEVRIYNRALTATEIQSDMNRPVTNPDTTPPSAPTNFARTGGSATTIATSWTPATDNVGVTEYRLYRDGVPAGTATTTAFTFTGLTCGTSANLEVEARDAVGNMSPRASLTAATDDCDVTPPSAPGTLTATGAIGRATLSWGVATDNVGVARYNVHRGSTAGFTPRPPTGSHSQPARATSTSRPQGPTTTASPRRTPPATSALPRTRRARSSPPTVQLRPRRRASPRSAAPNRSR